MATNKLEPEVLAVQQVFGALKPLDAEGQQRVLSAALSLLGLTFNLPQAGPESIPMASPTPVPTTGGGGRPKGLTEFVAEMKPGTSAQRILLFAYYRDKYEGFSNFAAGDLRPYFAKAKLSPPGNFDRDFASAVEKGWIHHDGPRSYVTQTGIDLVESGFAGARNYPDRGAASRTSNGDPKSKKKTTKKTTKKTSKK
ncbi:MAG: hypothetical protein AMXMBFR58_07640 [Phycisphaerae bacterium]